MNGWKKTTGLAAGLSVLLLLGSQAIAGSALPSMEELMCDGIAPPARETIAKTYSYDSSTPDAEEIMAEGITGTTPDPDHEYISDCTAPSAQSMMAEGICLETFNNPMMAKK